MSNTKISKQETEHIAKLAKLTLSEEEVDKFSSQLGETIDYVEKLKELNTEHVFPTFQTTGLKNVFREDEAGSSLTQKQALKNAKKTHKGYFVTKAVFD